MGIFDFRQNNNENNSSTTELLEKHDKGELNDELFLKDFGKAEVFYSTPFGDHKDGGKKLFLLPGPDGTGYHPVFSSQERLIEFYNRVGRVGFVIMKGTFTDVLVTTKNINADAPVKMGIVIDPGYFNVTVDAAVLDVVINMTR